MAKPGTVVGWKLDRSQRKELLERYRPRYPTAIADHVTLQAHAPDPQLPPDVDARIVGHADDGDSLEVMVVEVNGTSDRPDGSIFHITWSLDASKGRQPRESNDLLQAREWEKFDEPIAILVESAQF